MDLYRINRYGVWTMVVLYVLLFALLFWAGLSDRLPMDRAMDLVQIMAVVFIPAVLIAAALHPRATGGTVTASCPRAAPATTDLPAARG